MATWTSRAWLALLTLFAGVMGLAALRYPLNDPALSCWVPNLLLMEVWLRWPRARAADPTASQGLLHDRGRRATGGS